MTMPTSSFPDAPSAADQLRLSFAADLRAELQKVLAAEGMPVPASTTTIETCIAYFKVMRHRIEPAPRAVVWSAQLKARKLPSHVKQGVNAIIAESRQGRDMTPRLTKLRNNLEHNDGLLNDWGLHHMHLGTMGAEPDGSAGRTGELLFVFPTPSTLYLVDVRDHKGFSCHDLVEIVHKNWPFLLERYRVRAQLYLGPPPTDAERALARRSGLTMFTTMSDGTTYRPPGGGTATDGTSIAATDQAARLMHQVRDAAERCAANHAAILAHVQRESGQTLTSLQLSLRLADAKLVVVESQTGVVL